MRCRKHPSAELLQGKRWCFLCEQGGPGVEHDLRHVDYERMAQHVEPGVRGIRTRRQYQRLLKRHRLTDDVTTKELMDLTVNTAKRERVREEGIKKVTESLGERMRYALAQGVPVRTPTQHQLMQRLRAYLSTR